VFTYARLGRAIVLVTDDQLSWPSAARQNVRLASKLVGWDIEIMTHDELGEALERAERWFGQLPHASAELTGALIEEGFLSYNDITCTDAAGLAEFSGLNEEQSDEVVMYAEEYSDVMDQSVEEERRLAEEEAARLARSKPRRKPRLPPPRPLPIRPSSGWRDSDRGSSFRGGRGRGTPVEDANSEPVAVSVESPTEGSETASA